MRLVRLFVVVATLPLVASLQSRVSLEPDQSLHPTNPNWTSGPRTEPTTPLELTFALRQPRKSDLESLFWSVSLPSSPTYGHHVTLDELTQYVGATEETFRVIQGWLRGVGVRPEIQCRSVKTKDFLICTVPCGVAEVLLEGAAFHHFTHPDFPGTTARSVTAYTVPVEVGDHLDFIGGVHRFPALPTLRRQPPPPINEHIGVYPEVVRKRYNVSKTDVGGHANNSQSVAQFLEQYYHAADLKAFMLRYGGGFAHLDTIAKEIGPNKGSAGIEASLDTQYIMGVGANISTWFWSTGGRNSANQEPFLVWLTAVSDMTTVPWVHSVSYADYEYTLSKTYMDRVSVEFQKAGVRGLTLLFASGDNGAGCHNQTFTPMFPATSPYVTAVGGTAMFNPFGITGEFANDISGGGFSNTFTRAPYQTKQVEHFLTTNDKLPPSKMYNKLGRAYPDVSGLSRHFWIIENDIPTPGIAGTSAATPIWGGIISLLNERRLTAKKSPMGFVNPFLYEHPMAMYDVEKACHDATGCTNNDAGFCAAPGWDPVTGNGTPDYPKLAAAAMAAVGL